MSDAALGGQTLVGPQRVSRPVGLPARARRFVARQPFLTLGAVIFLLVAVCGILAPLLSSLDPASVDTNARLSAPSLAHPFGTDELGRDLYSRMLFGARISLTVALLSSLGALLVGGSIGLAAGFVGGWLDNLFMRCMDALYSFPSLVLAIAVVGMLGPGIVQAMIAIAVVSVPRYARMMRAQSLGLRRREYVTAARVAGAGDGRIALRHVLPNAMGVIFAQASAYAGFAVLAEASLSFLGLGVQPPTPAWGSLLKAGYRFLDDGPWLAIIPGAAISLLVLGFNLLGDGLRDLFDPRTR
jgi:ABC-type dipeptide/oligopeptide/nickel transport system permease subunit